MKSLAKVKSRNGFRFSIFSIFQLFDVFDLSFFFLNLSRFSTFRAKIHWTASFAFFFSSFRLFAAERYAFHGVTVTSQKGTQRLSGLCSKGIKITVTALEGWLGLRESSPNYRKFQVSEIYRNTQIRLVTHFPVFGSDFHIEDSFPNEQVKSENFPKCASSFFVYRFVTWCSCTHTPTDVHLIKSIYIFTVLYLYINIYTYLCMYTT